MSARSLPEGSDSESLWRRGPGLGISPRGSIYTTIMELGPQNHNGDGLLGTNSIIVVYMDPLGQRSKGLWVRRRVWGLLGTQKAHKPKHVIGISLPCLGFIIRGVHMGYPYPKFCLCGFLGP